MYADLCKLLGDKAIYWSEKYLKVQHMEEGPAGTGWYFDVSGIGQWQGPHATESAAKTEGHRQTNFKRLILNRCQQEFMKDDHYKHLDAEQVDDEARRAAGSLSPAEEKELAERAAARDYTRLKAKRRMLANIAFIGQLYRIEGMLTTTIMHFCIGRLLNGGVLPDDVKPDEEQMEAFFKLMVLIGSKLESDEARANEADRRLGTVMQLTDRLSRHPLLASRVRFMMRDLLDLRHNRWQLSGAAASIERIAVTKSRDEVRKIIAAEEAKPAGAPVTRAAAPRAPAPRPAAPGGGAVIKGRFTGSGASGTAGPASKGPASFGPRQAAAASAAAAAATAAAPGSEWQTVGAGGKVVAVASPDAVAADAASAASPGATSAPAAPCSIPSRAQSPPGAMRREGLGER